MGNEMKKGAQKPSEADIQAIHDELRHSPDLTLSRMCELLNMLPPTGVTESSAGIIRELRGPLPEDDPEYQRFVARGGDEPTTS